MLLLTNCSHHERDFILSGTLSIMEGPNAVTEELLVSNLQERRQELILVLHSLDGHRELPWVTMQHLMHPILQLCLVQFAIGQGWCYCHRASLTARCSGASEGSNAKPVILQTA